jgi:hypothetical protein
VCNNVQFNYDIITAKLFPKPKKTWTMWLSYIICEGLIEFKNQSENSFIP